MKAAASSCGPASSSEDGPAAGDLWVSRGAAYSLPGRCTSGTALMNPISPARPKNLATNTVAWPWASEFSIHCRHGLRMHDSLHPLRRTRHPLQLMMMMIFSFFFSADLKTKHLLPLCSSLIGSNLSALPQNLLTILHSNHGLIICTHCGRVLSLVL